MPFLSLLLACLLAAPAFSAVPSWTERFENARARAKAEGRLIFAALEAPWCHACYYMEGKVLSRPSFAKASRDWVLLRLDVDTQEGLSWKESRRLAYLPAYLLLDAEGREVGRLVGERSEAEFLEALKGLGEGQGSAGASASAEARLRKGLEAGELDEALSLRDALAARPGGPPRDADWKALSLRVDLLKALEADSAESASWPWLNLLELEPRCELAQDALRARPLFARLDPRRRREVLERSRAGLERLARRGVLGSAGERCADWRSAVDALAGTLSDLGLEEERRSFLGKAADRLQKDVRKSGLGADRSLDDNLRYVLEVLSRHEELDTLYPHLISVYPNDYVYAYRYARNLYGRGEFLKAWSWLEKASLLSYGVNRIGVEALRGRILAALGRRAEALRVLEDALRVETPRFPRDVAPLRSAYRELRASR